MVVNPILPSLRDHELQFILDDVDSRMIFVPADFRGHDYVAMLDRVTAAMDSPPEVVVVRGERRRRTRRIASLFDVDRRGARALPDARSRMRCG